jgi:hypothetical protein
MEIYVICVVTSEGRHVHAVDHNPKQAEEKAVAAARKLAREYNATYRVQHFCTPLSGGPDIVRVYHVRKAGVFVADVEICDIWE